MITSSSRLIAGGGGAGKEPDRLRRTLRAKYGQHITLSPGATGDALDESLKNLKEKSATIADPEYDTETIAYDMCMSRMQLNRKIHALTGYSTHGLVREIRLQRAADILAKQPGAWPKWLRGGLR